MTAENSSTKLTSGVKTLKAYVIGLVLCLLLTFASFGLAWMHQDSGVSSHSHLFSAEGLMFVLMFLAVVQLVVQVICFLRLNSSKEGRWETMPFLFVIFVVVVIAGGSLWIMWNLNYFMMH